MQAEVSIYYHVMIISTRHFVNEPHGKRFESPQGKAEGLGFPRLSCHIFRATHARWPSGVPRKSHESVSELLLEQTAQHPRRLFMNVETLGEQIGGRLVIRFIDDSE